jgi:hypothetical protein
MSECTSNKIYVCCKCHLQKTEAEMRKLKEKLLKFCKRCHCLAVKESYEKNHPRQRVYLTDLVGKTLTSTQCGDFKVLSVSEEVVIQFVNTGVIVSKSKSSVSKRTVTDPSVNGIVIGWGIQDADYPISSNGILCPVYSDWAHIIARGFSKRLKVKHTAYEDVTVCQEWQSFMNFRNWVLNVQTNKNWMNCVPDKDLLSTCVKVYSPETVVYLDRTTNNFLLDHKRARGPYMIGVSWKKQNKKFQSNCSNPFNKTSGYIGLFDTELEAHLAWQAKKHEYALLLAELQEDERASSALRVRYSPDKDWSKS